MRTLSRIGLSALALAVLAGGAWLLTHSAAEAHDNHHDNRWTESRSDERGWLGVSLMDVDDAFRERWNYGDRVSGAVVTEVRDDSPADDAGLRRHDVVIRVDGRRVRHTDALLDRMTDFHPGDEITLEVLRRGEERTLTATLASWPGSDRDGAGDRRFGVSSDDRDHGSRGGSGLWVESGGDDDGDTDVFIMKKMGDVVTIQRGDDDLVEFNGVDRVERRDGKVYIFRDGDDEPTVLHLDRGGDDTTVIHGESGGGGATVQPDRDRGGNVDRDRAPRDFNRGRDRERSERRSGTPRAFLGVMSQGLTGQLGEYFGVPDGEGVLITEVVEGSPAERIGLKAGDVIVAVDGRDVEDSGDLTRAVRRNETGDEVEITVVRDRSRRTFRAVLGDARDFTMDAAPFGIRRSAPRGDHSGPHDNHRFGPHHEGLHDLGLSDEDLEELHEGLRELHEELGPELRRALRDVHMELGPELRDQLHGLREEAGDFYRGLDAEEQAEIRSEIRRGLEEARRALREATRELRREIRDVRRDVRRGDDEASIGWLRPDALPHVTVPRSAAPVFPAPPAAPRPVGAVHPGSRSHVD